jgi:hypothetical protein
VEDGAASGVGRAAAVAPVLRGGALPEAREVAGRGGVAAVRSGVCEVRAAPPERADIRAGGVRVTGVPSAGAGVVASGSTDLAGVRRGVAVGPGAGSTGAETGTEDAPETLAAGRVAASRRAGGWTVGGCAVGGWTVADAADSCGFTGPMDRAVICPAGTGRPSVSDISGVSVPGVAVSGVIGSGATVVGAGATLSRRVVAAAVAPARETCGRTAPSTTA